MSVTSQDEKPIFLYTVQKGAASHSFGVAVAKLAGVPQEVIDTAQITLKELENRTDSSVVIPRVVEGSLHDSRDDKDFSSEPRNDRFDDHSLFEHILFKELENLNIANVTPLEALNRLAELKDKVQIIKKQYSQSETVET